MIDVQRVEIAGNTREGDDVRDGDRPPRAFPLVTDDQVVIAEHGDGVSSHGNKNLAFIFFERKTQSGTDCAVPVRKRQDAFPRRRSKSFEKRACGNVSSAREYVGGR